MTATEKNSRTHRILSRLFAWDPGTRIFALSIFMTFMAFNVFWCAWTTFTPFSHFPLYLSAILFTLILTLPYAMWRAKWVQVLLLVLLDFLLVANLMYARTYFGAIPLTSYTNAGNLADFMPSVWASIRWADIVFPLITGVTIWVLVKYSKRIGEAQRTNRICYLSWLGIFLLITLIAYPTPGHYKKHLKVLQSNAYAYQSIPAMYTVPGNLIFDALVAAEELTPQERSQTITFINSLPGVERLPEGVKAPKNLVFVFCESLESWVIGMDYYGQQVTPNLNRAIADSTTYYNPHVLSQAKDGRSIDGQLLDLTGLYPLTQGTYATIYADDYFPSIHKALKQDRGSYNVLLTGDKEYAWNQGRIARSFGMDTLVTFKDFRIEDSFTGRRHIGDRALMRQIVEKLKKGDLWKPGTPAFLQMVTYSGHGPFLLPDSEKKIKIHSGTPEIMGAYLNVAHYTDEALGILIDYLKSRPDWSETMVVITGDHEGLASWREECLNSPDGRKMVPEGQYVPLLIMNSPLPGRSDKTIGQVDIYSTLMHLMGLTRYDWPGLGQSALSPLHPGIAISPQGKIFPAGQEGNPSVGRLRKSATTADRILRYDLLRK